LRRLPPEAMLQPMPTAAPLPKRARRTSHRLALAAVATFIALLAAEILTRAFLPAAGLPEIFPGFQLVPSEGVLGDDDPPPMVRHATRFFAPAPDQGGVFGTDEYGFRGGRRPASHGRLLRVAIVGDSVAMGFGMRYGDGFAGVAERELRRQTALDVDVANAGCAGYSTLQCRVDLEERVLPLAPQVVVIALTGWNDAAPALLENDAAWARRFAAEASFQRSPLAASRLATAIALRLFRPDPSHVAEGKAALARRERPFGDRVPADHFRANVTAMIATVEAAGAEPLLLLLPPRNDAAIDPGPHQRLAIAREEAAIRGVRSLEGGDVLAALDLGEARKASLFLDRVHPSAIAHRALGIALAARILEIVHGEWFDDAAGPGPTAEIASHDLESGSGDGAHVLPRPTRIVPGEAFAFGGTEVTIGVDGLRRGDDPRFFLGGEPLPFPAPSGVVPAITLVLPPLPTGRLDLELVTRRGTSVLEEALIALPPQLELVSDAVAVCATLRAIPGAPVRLLAASRLAPRAVAFGRTFDLAKDAMLPLDVAGTTDADGVFEIRVPLPRGPRSGAFHLQAIVSPPAGPRPRVPLFSDAVRLELP
jgi:lysophospholipase L1-like esterase